MFAVQQWFRFRPIYRLAFVCLLIPATTMPAQTDLPEATKESEKSAGQVINIFHLQSAEAAHLGKLLQLILNASSSPADAKPGTKAAVVTADVRTNSLLVFGTAHEIEIAKLLLNELDQKIGIDLSKERAAAIDQHLERLEQDLQSLRKEIKSVRDRLPPTKVGDSTNKLETQVLTISLSKDGKGVELAMDDDQSHKQTLTADQIQLTIPKPLLPVRLAGIVVTHRLKQESDLEKDIHVVAKETNSTTQPLQPVKQGNPQR